MFPTRPDFSSNSSPWFSFQNRVIEFVFFCYISFFKILKSVKTDFIHFILRPFFSSCALASLSFAKRLCSSCNLKIYIWTNNLIICAAHCTRRLYVIYISYYIIYYRRHGDRKALVISETCGDNEISVKRRNILTKYLTIASLSFSTKIARDDARKWSLILWLLRICLFGRKRIFFSRKHLMRVHNNILSLSPSIHHLTYSPHLNLK